MTQRTARVAERPHAISASCPHAKGGRPAPWIDYYRTADYVDTCHLPRAEAAQGSVQQLAPPGRPMLLQPVAATRG